MRGGATEHGKALLAQKVFFRSPKAEQKNLERKLPDQNSAALGPRVQASQCMGSVQGLPVVQCAARVAVVPAMGVPLPCL